MKEVIEKKSVTRRRSVKRKTAVKKTVKTPIKKNIIQSKEAYDLTMQEIDSLMKRGEANLTAGELKRLTVLAAAAEAFEDLHDPMPLPSSLQEIIRIRLLQLHIKQNFAAKLLGVSDAKFSLIMNGKQKPDILFVKAIHEKLSVDANVILKAI
ncbi:transcriptional regulator [Flavihumibacter solisilvae]|uniref:transcriptional regulator n=1 Tax=Flavihumibacter solisilvae TaxID=1349421 RepID=UPI0006924993|nr:transcriptional regulator [Flavihumibacter solisilvae]